jgi:LAO/AO transport system kinase
VTESNAHRRALARLITGIESGDAAALAMIRAAGTQTYAAHRVGVTGPPGAGKSTLVNAMALHWRARGQTVAILSIDPSSPLTGGAILGDRIRMRELSGDTGVFIRSMASRGLSGGVASATADIVIALERHGFDRIVIETVGAGQSEVDIARLADTVLLVEAPGMGDDIQAIKAGIIEIADVIVVNKADKPDAAQTVAALRAALDLAVGPVGHHGPGSAVPETPSADWGVPVLATVAAERTGVEAVCDALDAHRLHLRDSPAGAARRQVRARLETLARLREAAYVRALQILGEPALNALVEAVARGVHPGPLIDQLLSDTAEK